MILDELVIKNYPFKKSPANKKTGLYQIKLRVFIGKNYEGIFQKNRTLEIKLFDNKKSLLHLSANDFNTIKKNSSLLLNMLNIPTNIEDVVKKMISEDIELTSTNLTNCIYFKNDNLSENAEESEKMIYHKDSDKFFGDSSPRPKAVIDKFNKSVSEIPNDEIVSFEDLEDIAESTKWAYLRDKELKQIAKMDFNERYAKGYFDKNNIFEAMGFCWSRKKINNDTHVPDSYKSLIMQLNDFRYNAIPKPSANVRDFNSKWIEDFLKFKWDNGYLNIHLKNYDPFSVVDFRDRIESAKRSPYKTNSFESLVKRLKRYVSIIQKNNIIPLKIDTGAISASDYYTRKTIRDRYTRINHHLNLEEFDQLAEFDFKDKRLNIARDMFVVAVLAGGLRLNELYKPISIVGNTIQICRSKSKNKKITTNPIYGELKRVFERHGGMPSLLDEKDFRKALKEIANTLNFNRVILDNDTTLHSEKDEPDQVMIKEIFNPYFARKTCVFILNKFGLSEEDIIEFTQHEDRATLKYYKDKMSTNDKEELIVSKMNKFYKSHLNINDKEELINKQLNN
jgi:hypothetical protein